MVILIRFWLPGNSSMFYVTKCIDGLNFLKELKKIVMTFDGLNMGDEKL